MSDFMVPFNEKFAASQKMRDDAKKAAGSLEGGQSGGPYLYLAQHDATAVTERNEGRGGDWIVAGLPEKKVCNLGAAPLLVVMSQHRRFKYEIKVKGQTKPKIVWDAAREAMTDEQAEQADIQDWHDPRKAKPYNLFMLLAISKDGINPIGPFRYAPTAGSAKDSNKWVDDLGNLIPKGIAPFAAVWELGSVMSDTGHGSKKLAMTHKLHAVIPDSHPLYVTLEKNWKGAQEQKEVLKGRAMSPAADDAPPSNIEDMADQHAEAGMPPIRVIHEAEGQATVGEYATSLSGDDEAPAPSNVIDLPPAIPGDTEVVVEVVDGKPVRGKVGSLVVQDARLAEQYYKNLVRDMHNSPHLPRIKALLAAVTRRKEFLENLSKQSEAEPPF